MGNSLEQYRQRIGSYQFSGTKPRRRYRSTFSNTKLFNSVFKQSGRKTNLKEVSYCIIFYIIIFSVIEKISSGSSSGTSFSKTQSFHDPCRSISSNSKYFWVSSKARNKLCHSLEGNRRNYGYKYFAWNCDRGFLSENKLADLKCFAYRSKIQIIGVSEIDLVRDENNKNEKSTNNLSTEQVHRIFKINGYSIILPESWNTFGKARILLYVHDELNVKICDLQDDEKHLQTVSLEVGFGRASKHIYNFYYREWKSFVTGQSDTNTQLTDTKKLMNIWTRCCDSNKDFVSMGDMNLCALKWNDPGFPHPQLASLVHDFMLSENCEQLVNEYTRIRSVNRLIQRSYLDHVTTNCVSKISRPEVLGFSKSDHLGILIIKKSQDCA